MLKRSHTTYTWSERFLSLLEVWVSKFSYSLLTAVNLRLCTAAQYATRSVHQSMSSGGLCVAYAAAGGALGVASATVLAYPAHLAKRRGVASLYGRWGSAFFIILNVVFGLAAVGMFVLATGQGPVALAMPIQTGTMLLLNMVVRACVRACVCVCVGVFRRKGTSNRGQAAWTLW